MVPILSIALTLLSVSGINGYILTENDLRELCSDTIGMIGMGFKSDYVVDTIQKVIEKKWLKEHLKNGGTSADVGISLTERALVKNLINEFTKAGKKEALSVDSSRDDKAKTYYQNSYGDNYGDGYGDGNSYGNSYGYGYGNSYSSNSINMQLKDVQEGPGSILLGSDLTSTGEAILNVGESVTAQNALNKLKKSEVDAILVRYPSGSSATDAAGAAGVRTSRDNFEDRNNPLRMRRQSTDSPSFKASTSASGQTKNACYKIKLPALLNSVDYSQWNSAVKSIQQQVDSL